MKTLLSNWREVLIGVLAFSIVTFLFLLLGSKQVHDNPALDLVVTGLVQLAMGGLRFAMALILVWFGLAVTYPEANRHIVGSAFDDWWKALTTDQQSKISLTAAAVLAIVAGLCMAA